MYQDWESTDWKAEYDRKYRGDPDFREFCDRMDRQEGRVSHLDVDWKHQTAMSLLFVLAGALIALSLLLRSE